MFCCCWSLTYIRSRISFKDTNRILEYHIRLELFTIFQVSKILSRFSSRKIYFFCQDYNSKTTRPTLDLVFGNPREIYFYLRKIKKVSFLFGVCGEHGKLGLSILREEIFLQLSNYIPLPGSISY